MGARPDRDPTDLGLLSFADREVLQLRHQPRHEDAGEPSRTIGPVAPPTGTPSEQVRGHVDAIYAQQGWTRPVLSEDEQLARTQRCRRVSCHADRGRPCTDFTRGRRRAREVSHGERLVDAIEAAESLREGVEDLDSMRRG